MRIIKSALLLYSILPKDHLLSVFTKSNDNWGRRKEFCKIWKIDLISIFYANIQNHLCSLVAPCSQFIDTEFQMRNNLSKSWWQTMTANPVKPSALLTFGRSTTAIYIPRHTCCTATHLISALTEFALSECFCLLICSTASYEQK